MGKSGGCASAQTEAISRLISLAMRAGVDQPEIVKHLRGIRCHNPAWDNGGMILSCPDALGLSLQHFMGNKAAEAVPVNGEPTVAAVRAVPSDGPKGLYLEPEARLSASLSRMEHHVGACPDCGAVVEHEGGCVTCRLCGYSKCS